MKKKGFTLIELLAVIVVLAIIALIATPIVMNVIKNAQMGAVERSADNYVKAVETAIATDRLENNLIEDGTYNIVDGQLEGTTLDIEVSGTKPVGGTITIKDGQVDKDNTTINYEDYKVTFTDGKAEAKEKGDILVLCTATIPSTQNIFDMENWTMTTATVGVQATAAAPYSLGAEYVCDLGDGERTFFVLGEEGNNVKLILNENLGGYLPWNNTGVETMGKNEMLSMVNEALSSKTSGWTKIKEVGGKVTLPNGQDIAVASGVTDWNYEKISTLPLWLITNFDAANDTNKLSYWVYTDDIYMWHLSVHEALRDYDYITGMPTSHRPVITIPKASTSLQ